LVRNRDDINTVEEAVVFLRSQLENAEGTAKQFADGLNDTFAGAITLLGGTMETLAVVIGEPIANVLKPVVQALTGALNFLLQAFENLPGPVKKAISGILVGVAAVAAIGAAAIAATAAFTLLSPPIILAATAVGGFVVAALPLIVTVAAIGAAVALLVIGIRTNFAGLGDLWDDTFGRVILLTKALIQLFSSGELSGAVLEELNQVENSGVKQFAITLFAIGFRIKRFFEGLVIGITETLGGPLERMGSALEGLARVVIRVWSLGLRVFMRIGRAFGLISKKGAEVTAKTPSSAFFKVAFFWAKAFGTVLGFTLDVISTVIDALVFVVDTLSAGIEAVIDFGASLRIFGAIADFIIGEFTRVKNFIEDLFEFIIDTIETVKQVAEIAADPLGSAEFFVRELTTGKTGRLLVAQQRGGAEGVREQLEIETERAQRQQQTSFGEVGETFLGEGAKSDAELIDTLRRLADQGERPINVQVQTSSGEVLFEQTQQGAAESEARSFDVTDRPL
jgi:hypothetical protein